MESSASLTSIHALIHANFTSHTTSYFPTFSSLPQLLLSSNEMNGGIISTLFFWEHHTPIQIVAQNTEALDTVLVYQTLC